MKTKFTYTIHIEYYNYLLTLIFSNLNFFQVAISGLAIVAVIALILGITLTTDRRRNGDKLPYVSKSGEPITFDEFLRDGSRTHQYI